MVRMAGRWLVVLVAGLLGAGQDPGSVPPPPPRPVPEPMQSGEVGRPGAVAATETPGLLATQVSVAVDREGSRRRFRATVLQVDHDEVTIFTAAHCMSEADKGWPAALLFGGGVVAEGVVADVVRNPRYRPNQPREIPGPDNAVARLRFRIGAGPIVEDGTIPSVRLTATRDPAAIEAFRAIRPAPALTTRYHPGPGGGAVAVRMIDGHGVEHAVRAGNYSNPFWLEWGRAYQPIPGDSGGGVFVMSPGPAGTPRPVLIGIIVGRDDRGGGASLISLGESWVANALKRPPPAP